MSLVMRTLPPPFILKILISTRRHISYEALPAPKAKWRYRDDIDPY